MDVDNTYDPTTKYKFVRDVFLNYVYKRKKEVKGSKISGLMGEYVEYLDLISFVVLRSYLPSKKDLRDRNYYYMDEEVEALKNYYKLNKKFKINDKLNKYFEEYRYLIDDYKYIDRLLSLKFKYNSYVVSALAEYVYHVKKKINDDKKYTRDELKEKFDLLFRDDEDFSVKDIENYKKRLITGIINSYKISQREWGNIMGEFLVSETFLQRHHPPPKRK